MTLRRGSARQVPQLAPAPVACGACGAWLGIQVGHAPPRSRPPQGRAPTFRPNSGDGDLHFSRLEGDRTQHPVTETSQTWPHPRRKQHATRI